MQAEAKRREANSYQFQSNTPHAGCNSEEAYDHLVKFTFQSNAPRAGCKEVNRYACGVFLQHFNLTHPVRGATNQVFARRLGHFNLTHPMRGATKGCTTMLHRFQSNALRARCNYMLVIGSYVDRFNLTHPVRGAIAKLYNLNML